MLRDAPPREFLGVMYGNEPLRWSEALSGAERLALHHQRADAHPLRHRRRHARVRDQGRRRAAPAGLPAWFDAPGRRTAGTPIAFGHWSTLGLVDRPDLLGSTPAASGAAS